MQPTTRVSEYIFEKAPNVSRNEMLRLFSLFTLVKGKKVINIQEIPVKDHYIFYCESQQHGKTHRKGKLVGE